MKKYKLSLLLIAISFVLPLLNIFLGVLIERNHMIFISAILFIFAVIITIKENRKSE